MARSGGGSPSRPLETPATLTARKIAGFLVILPAFLALLRGISPLDACSKLESAYGQPGYGPATVREDSKCRFE